MIFRSGSTTTCGPASQALLAFAGAACARCGRSKRFKASNSWKQSLHPIGWSAKFARNQSTNPSWGFRQPTQHGLPAADALSLCRAFSNLVFNKRRFCIFAGKTFRSDWSNNILEVTGRTSHFSTLRHTGGPKWPALNWNRNKTATCLEINLLKVIQTPQNRTRQPPSSPVARARRDTRRRDHGRPVVAALLAATQRSAVQFFERLHRASSYRRRESAPVPSGTPESLRGKPSPPRSALRRGKCR